MRAFCAEVAQFRRMNRHDVGSISQVERHPSFAKDIGLPCDYDFAEAERRTTGDASKVCCFARRRWFAKSWVQLTEQTNLHFSSTIARSHGLSVNSSDFATALPSSRFVPSP